MLHNTTNIYQYAYLLMFIKKNASLYAYSGGYPFSISGDIRSLPS